MVLLSCALMLAVAVGMDEDVECVSQLQTKPQRSTQLEQDEVEVTEEHQGATEFEDDPCYWSRCDDECLDWYFHYYDEESLPDCHKNIFRKQEKWDCSPEQYMVFLSHCIPPPPTPPPPPPPPCFRNQFRWTKFTGGPGGGHTHWWGPVSGDGEGGCKSSDFQDFKCCNHKGWNTDKKTGTWLEQKNGVWVNGVRHEEDRKEYNCIWPGSMPTWPTAQSQQVCNGYNEDLAFRYMRECIKMRPLCVGFKMVNNDWQNVEYFESRDEFLTQKYNSWDAKADEQGSVHPLQFPNFHSDWFWCERQPKNGLWYENQADVTEICQQN